MWKRPNPSSEKAWEVGQIRRGGKCSIERDCVGFAHGRAVEGLRVCRLQQFFSASKPWSPRWWNGLSRLSVRSWRSHREGNTSIGTNRGSSCPLRARGRCSFRTNGGPQNFLKCGPWEGQGFPVGTRLPHGANSDKTVGVKDKSVCRAKTPDWRLNGQELPCAVVQTQPSQALSSWPPFFAGKSQQQELVQENSHINKRCMCSSRSREESFTPTHASGRPPEIPATRGSAHSAPTPMSH